MAWNICIIHKILAIVGYIFWLVAALSGAIYLVIQGAQSVSSPDDPQAAEQLLDSWERIRFKLTSTYLILGLLSFTAALAMGFLKANAYWQNYWPWEIKVAFSVITWVYYCAIVAAIPILKWRKHESIKELISTLAVYGIGFVALNIFLSHVSKLHQYL